MQNEKYLFLLLGVLVIGGFYFLLTSAPKPCNDHSLDSCPSSCVVCPPCPYCSSIACQSEEFCKSQGFNRSWSESVRP